MSKFYTQNNKKMKTIKNIKARQILDSRGNPTVEVDVILQNGCMGRASVPSGASTGSKEAIELRDNNKEFLGKGVYNAIQNIHRKIYPELKGININKHRLIDQKMIKIDNTKNKNNLGANAILGVSLASIRAASIAESKPIYRYLNNTKNYYMPAPMINIINGGSHANNSLDIQEFMIFPLGFNSFSKALQSSVEIFHHLKKILNKKKHNTSVGDEGGFAPNLNSNEEAIEIIIESILKAGYIPGKEIFIALDIASSEFYNKNKKKYYLHSDQKEINSHQLVDYYEHLISKYPIISIEDGLDEEDWEGWIYMNQKLGQDVQIVGDDITVTNIEYLTKAIKLKAINAILIKLNQIGSVSETLDTIKLAKKNNINTIISHRSGETEDTSIADLSVAVKAMQIKTGSLSRTDRTAKYNQLLRIEEEIGSNAIYSGPIILKKIRNVI